jgi:hypothetical protein
MELTFSEASSLLQTKIALRVTFHNNITTRLLKMFFEVAHIRLTILLAMP